MNRLLVIDGNSILNRAYYGIRMLNAPDGTPTNAVYGFLNILLKQLDEQKPDGVCVAFDVKEKTFRHKMYDKYKAQRKPAPEDFLVQLPLIKEVLGAMNISCIELPGYEADDIIGTISRICEEENTECIILTGDKDDLQLASETVKINLVVTRMGNTSATLYDDKAVFEKYGVTPKEFVDVKGLMGDPSDNIPGAAGIGEKTAFSLISKYKSIDYIYENIENLDITKSVLNKLKASEETVKLSQTLATIDRYVPAEYNTDEFAIREYKEELGELFDRLNFRQLSAKLGLSCGNKKEKIFCDKSCIACGESRLKNLKGEFLFYRFYPGENSLAVLDDEEYLIYENVSETGLRAFFEGNCKKIGYGIKEDIIFLNAKKIDYSGLFFDVMIGAYILNPSRSGYELQDIALEFAGIEIGENKEESGGQMTMDFGDEKEKDLSARAAKELFAVRGLYNALTKQIKENNQEKLCFEIEMPLIRVLADMQTIGVMIDKEALSDFGRELDEKIKTASSKIYEYAGREFNINSPKQLGEVLFVEMGLPHGRKTKTGYSTNADILEKLKTVHPIIGEILEFRQVSKLKSTYVEGLMSVIDPKTGRIHSNFNQTVTATGRISSTEPNLQNIPVRTKLGRQMRKMFVAADDMVLADADYSQIELRVLSHISGDGNMQNAFLKNTDIHTETAAKVFGVSEEDVTSEMRTQAKAVNFGIVYGISEYSLSQDLDIPFGKAKKYIEDYFSSYPKIKEYLENVVEKGKKDGFVSTLFSRRRYVPELRAENKITKSFGERVAMNAPIQGTAADIIKIAMVNVHKALKAEKLHSRLILQIHDELIVESLPNEIERVSEILKNEMENAVRLSVPLCVELNTGKSWYDTK